MKKPTNPILEIQPDKSKGRGAGERVGARRAIKTYLKRVPGLRSAIRFVRGRTGAELPRNRLLRRMPKHSVCAEIGVHEGDFSVEILRRVKPAALHLIDPWRHEGGQEYQTAWYSVGQSTMESRYESVLRRFDKEIKRKRVQVHRAYSSVAVTSFPDDYFDWVYIDGNHLDEFVRKDLELYYPKVKSGGYLTGEDYGVEGWWKNGVQTAVDDFVRTRGLKFELIETQFVFRKPRND